MRSFLTFVAIAAAACFLGVTSRSIRSSENGETESDTSSSCDVNALSATFAELTGEIRQMRGQILAAIDDGFLAVEDIVDNASEDDDNVALFRSWLNSFKA